MARNQNIKPGPTVRGMAVAAGSGFISALPLIFLSVLLVPMVMRVGPLVLLPHRLMLVAVFFPLAARLLSGQAGRVNMIDYALAFSAAWASLAILVGDGSSKIEPIGIYWVEFFGAYLIGRVCIRSSADFYRFVRFYFAVMLILLPFVVLEAVLHRPILLDLIPNSLTPTVTDARWGLRRAQGPFAHPILFGIFASCAFGMCWYMLRSGFLRFAGAGVSALATMMSLSTGALLSVVMQSLFIGWELMTKPAKWRWRVFALGLILTYVTIDLLSNRSPFHVLVSYATFNTGSSFNRILIWQYGLENVYSRPWFGLGLDVMNWDRPHWMVASADNFWLLTAMTYGIPSFAGLAVAVFLIIRRVALAPLQDPFAQICRAGFLTSLGGIIIAGGTVHYWHSMLAFVMFIFGSGVWMTEAQDGAPPKDEAGDQGGDDEAAGLGRADTRYTRFAPVARRARKKSE